MENDASFLPFFKMEGCGNDYVFIDVRKNTFQPPLSAKEIQQISDRHTGIGSDGLVIVGPSDKAPLSMSMWNADGTSSAMCGNALRCLALWEYYCSGKKNFSIETPAGLCRARVLFLSNNETPRLEIEMPAPVFDLEKMPLACSHIQKKSGPISILLSVEGFGLQEVHVLSMGNAHCVLFVEDIDHAPVSSLGPALESHPAFPERINVEFVSLKKSPNEEGIFVRTFERGSKETLACGSGACAAHVVSVLLKNAPKKQNVFQSGGCLDLEWHGSLEDKSPVMMRGPARLVYEGKYRRKIK